MDPRLFHEPTETGILADLNQESTWPQHPCGHKFVISQGYKQIRLA